MHTIADLNLYGVDIVQVIISWTFVIRRVDESQVSTAVDCKVVLVRPADDRIRHRITRHVGIANGDLGHERHGFIHVDAGRCATTIAGDRDSVVVDRVQRDTERTGRRRASAIIHAERKTVRQIFAVIVIVSDASGVDFRLRERGGDHSVQFQLAVTGVGRHCVSQFASGIVNIGGLQHRRSDGVAR